MERLFMIFLIAGVIYLIVCAIKALIRSASHVPTWGGIILSAILGMLPLYLILCFFGIMGETRDKTLNEAQSYTGSYAEEMSKRYAYNNSPKKGNSFIIVVCVLVAVFLLYALYSKRTEEQDVVSSTETYESDNIMLEEQKNEQLPIVKRDLPVKKQETRQERSCSEMEKPLKSRKENVFNNRLIKSDIKIPQENNDGVRISKKKKSTLELLEEQTHANAVQQAKEAGVSTEGSTIEILERITHANAVQQAKEAGVSTEGSTIEILERITLANAVQQAKEAGVSAEGSTTEILERIMHANVVRQAKEAGVSTEGSTTEILERITRKNLEEDL